MKNNFLFSFVLLFQIFSFSSQAQELEINSSSIQHDATSKITIFEGNVSSSDERGNKL